MFSMINSKIGTGLAFLAFFIVMSACIYMDWLPLLAFPVGLLIIYTAIFYPQGTIVALFFFAPLSINIEQWSDSFGLFIPTEPVLFGLMLLVVWRGLFKKFSERDLEDRFLTNHPLIWVFIIYLSIIFILSIPSALPIVSFKSLLAKLWYIIPIFTIGFRAFTKEKNIRIALWLYVLGLTVVILYTLINHAQYGFAEKQSHWVMDPFFKDHTSYGAAIAFCIPIIIGLYFSKKYDLMTSSFIALLLVIVLVGLYFSYTRAAWISLIGTTGVWFLIHYKIKFSFLFTMGVIVGSIVILNWSEISYLMSKNKQEHTTEHFGDRLESAANISSDASNLERINRWNCAIQMFLEKPLTGFGPGTYAFEYAPFQKPENKTIISTNFGNGGNAHSEFLLALSEMGIFGLLAFIAVVSMFFYTCIKLYYRITDRNTKILALVMILASVTYFIHAFLNNFLDQDKIAIPIYGVMAMFLAIEFNLSKKENA